MTANQQVYLDALRLAFDALGEEPDLEPFEPGSLSISEASRAIKASKHELHHLRQEHSARLGEEFPEIDAHLAESREPSSGGVVPFSFPSEKEPELAGLSDSLPPQKKSQGAGSRGSRSLHKKSTTENESRASA